MLCLTPKRLRLNPAQFPTGVSAGEMQSSSVLIATKSTFASPVLRVFRETGAGGQIRLVNETVAAPSAEGFVQLRVTGLAPGTTYRYVFLIPDGASGFNARSTIGSVRTALAEDDLLR